MTAPLTDVYAGRLAWLPVRSAGSVRLLLGLGLITASASAANRPTPYDAINSAAAASSIKVSRLRGGVAMLDGSGGNIGVLTTSAGKLMVDAGISVSEAKIKAALRSLGPQPLRTVVLTHWHWDHSDGDAWVRRAGATLIADRATVARLKQTNTIVEWGHTFTPIAADALPTVVLTEGKSLTFGAETVDIGHYKAGHTDGDLYVRFRRADVLQTGDTFWNGVYPFIDYVTGGSIDGAIRAANENMRLAGKVTMVIPGHGPVGDRADLIAFRDMLVTVRARVMALKAQGKSVEAVVAAHPTADLDGRWAGGVIDGALFTALVYRGV